MDEEIKQIENSKKIVCRNCESDNLIITTEPYMAETSAGYFFIIFCAFCALFIGLGLYLKIKGQYEYFNLLNNFSPSKDTIEENISYTTYFLIQLQKTQHLIYIGDIIINIASLILFVMVLFHLLMPKHNVKTKKIIICQNCGKKWDFDRVVPKE